jgi:Zn-dependent protease
MLMGLNLYNVAISIIPMIFAITVHEFAHGWAAKRYGDLTAYSQGRVTLDPLNHIDPIGTILVPIVSLALSGFMFGWARPVPVNFSRLNNIRADGIKVALAGPISNFLMAVIWSLILAGAAVATQASKLPFFENLFNIAEAGISINLVFMLFNLIPLLPLDGGRALQLALPHKYSKKMDFMEDYGMWIVFFLAYAGVLGILIRPIEAYLHAILMLPTVLSYSVFLSL